MCLAQGHITLTAVRLHAAKPRSGDMHSTTEPQRSLNIKLFCVFLAITTSSIYDKILSFTLHKVVA